MVRSALVLLAAASTATALFSVNDDILAFPQFEIQFSPDPIPVSEATALLSTPPPPTPSESYESLILDSTRYLCTVPVVQAPPALNATEKELSRAAEEKELARATTRGWELLSGLEGECLYFVSGWWSYSYCHNREVRQFHQKAPSAANGGAPAWPPAEDPATPSYVLGMVAPEKRDGAGAGTELQATGELRFLVQKLGGGTTCDLTRKERKIEIQFHCATKGTHDRIGWIKEISICCYLMVVYTPRLCDDVAFLPPREDRANAVQCRAIMEPEEIEEYYAEQAELAELERQEAMGLLQAALGLDAGQLEDAAAAAVAGDEEGQGKKKKKKGKKAVVVEDGEKAEQKGGKGKGEKGGKKKEEVVIKGMGDMEWRMEL